MKTAAVDPANRMNSTQAIKHIWISERGSLSDIVTINDRINCFIKA